VCTTVYDCSYYIKFVSSTEVFVPTHRRRFPVLLLCHCCCCCPAIAQCVCRRPVGVWSDSLLRWYPAVVSPPTIILFGFLVKWLRLTWIPFYHGRNTIDRSWTARVRITSILFFKMSFPASAARLCTSRNCVVFVDVKLIGPESRFSIAFRWIPNWVFR